MVFNSTNLDCNKKFRNFKRSGLALQKISDTVCLQHGLSIIESPQEKGKSYDKWLGNAKPLGNREQLVFVIDSVLPKCKTWEDFIAELKSLGCEVKQGAHIAV
ncbi:MAG: relaxase/mobilization nuclease domain-containing protein, partial [Clostridiales Family XIII bacterium]|nr:relaxase/mobilization nuclease domain-containing protein [Clostridiales Family XIII bacterium]